MSRIGTNERKIGCVRLVIFDTTCFLTLEHIFHTVCDPELRVSKKPTPTIVVSPLRFFLKQDPKEIQREREMKIWNW